MEGVEEASFGMVESEELQFQLPEGVSVAGKCWGDERATINVLAMHGYLDSAATFDRLAPQLVHYSHFAIRVVAFDFSGQGKSSHRADPTNYFTAWVAEGPQLFLSSVLSPSNLLAALTVADAMGWATFCIMAHSMATSIAVITAGALPGRVEKMILLDHIGPTSIPPEKTPSYLEQALQQRLNVLQRQSKTYPDIESLVERMRNSDAQLSDASVRILMTRTVQRVADGVKFSQQ